MNDLTQVLRITSVAKVFTWECGGEALAWSHRKLELPNAAPNQKIGSSELNATSINVGTISA
jgi:hypothetical protein